MKIDFHMHSTFSDGLRTPTELVDMAVESKLAAISLTDHDCLEGIGEAIEAGVRKGIEVVPGVELSSEFRGRDLHILGYGIDPDDADFQEMLRRFRETRYARAVKIVDKLNALGLALDAEEVIARSGEGAIGRPHIAAVLVEKGYVSNAGEAFVKYLAEGGPAHVKKYKMSPEEAIRHIRAAGGLAFAAHPGVFLENMDEANRLIAEGFDGIEVFHPRHDQRTTETLKILAGKNGLLISGGSDFHGFNDRDTPLGSLDVPYGLWQAMKAKLPPRN